MKEHGSVIKCMMQLALVASMASLFFTCSDDKDTASKGDASDMAVNRWVLDSMKRHYLWKDEMPSSPKLDQEYEKFFKGLLSLKDGKHSEDGESGYYYSAIRRFVGKDYENTRADEDYLTSSFGFGYIITYSFLYDERISDDEQDYYAKKYITVVWVTKGSQAEAAGLKRGDHIYKINGREIPDDGASELLANLTAPLSGSSSVSLTTCKLDLLRYVTGTNQATGETFAVPEVTRKTDKDNSKTITLTSSPLDEPPVYYATVFQAGGRNVGYLVYNAFERGGAGRYYDEQLVNTFADLKRQGVNELVLDLRYNPGGHVSTCQLLASLIAPSSFVGDVFQNSVYVDGKITPYTFLRQANSLELPRVYIMATGYSASASEVLLHCLGASGIQVYHIGNTTEGKNVGQSVFSTEDLKESTPIKQQLGRYEYLAYIVSFNIKDANGDTYPSTGIDPRKAGSYGYWFDEEFVVDFKELGDPAEPMLAAALTHISTGSFPQETRVVQSSRGSGSYLLGKGFKRNPKPSRPYVDE